MTITVDSDDERSISHAAIDQIDVILEERNMRRLVGAERLPFSLEQSGAERFVMALTAISTVCAMEAARQRSLFASAIATIPGAVTGLSEGPELSSLSEL